MPERRRCRPYCFNFPFIRRVSRLKVLCAARVTLSKSPALRIFRCRPLKKRGTLLPDLLGTRGPAGTGNRRLRARSRAAAVLAARAIREVGAPSDAAPQRPRGATPVGSLSATLLGWPSPEAAPAPIAVTAAPPSASDVVFCPKGAANALGFRPAYWTYDTDAEGQAGSLRPLRLDRERD